MIKFKLADKDGFAELDAGYQILDVYLYNKRVRVAYNADYDSPIKVQFAVYEIGQSPDIEFEYVGTHEQMFIYVKDCNLQDQVTHANTCPYEQRDYIQ